MNKENKNLITELYHQIGSFIFGVIGGLVIIFFTVLIIFDGSVGDLTMREIFWSYLTAIWAVINAWYTLD